MAGFKAPKPQKPHSVIYGEGLDLITSAIAMPPGRAVAMKNFECDTNGGYELLRGRERVDGRTSPTRGDWVVLRLVDTTGFVVSEVATGTTSTATGTIIFIGLTSIYMAGVVGTFVDGEPITTSSQNGTSADDPFLNAVLDDELAFKDVRYAKEIFYRDLISAVPGIGKVLGVYRHLDKLYAFRNLNGSEAKMYEATASGWAIKTFGHIVFFNTGTVRPTAEEITLNDGVGNTATFVAVVYTTTAETDGYIVLADYTVGFAPAAIIKEGAITVATVATAPAAIMLDIDGRYEFISHNFSGGVSTYRIYGCDNVNPGFEYRADTDRFVPIFTDQENTSIDNPMFVAAYKQQLFFEFQRGIIRNSEPNDVLLWDAAAGTVELGSGAEAAGLDPTAQALIVMTRRITYALTGDIAENFDLDVASAQTGAIPYTLQHLGTTYSLDDRGIIELLRVQAFGNFDNATVSKRIKPLLEELQPLITASVVNRSLNRYRLLTSDGRGVSMTLQDGNVVGFGFIDYAVGINVTSNSEDETGAERIYIGSDNGFVYEIDIGQSFDGDAKEAWLKPTPHFLDTPTLNKRFFRMYVGSVISGEAILSVAVEYSLSSADREPVPTTLATFSGLASAWDVGKWDEARWDATTSPTATVPLDGTGDAISVIFYSNSATNDVIAIKDVTYHFKNRRMQRGPR